MQKSQQIRIMEKSEKCLEQCHRRTKVSKTKIITDNSILRMPRVRDGKSIARPKLCVTLEGPQTTNVSCLAFIITFLAFANCLNLALGSYANDIDGDAPFHVLKPFNLINNLREENNINNSNTDTILNELQLSEAQTR